MAKFTDLQDDIVDFFKERLENFSIPMSFTFYYQENSKQKQLIKLTKIPEQYSVILNKDILVQVNAEYFDSFSTEGDDINTILFDQAIDMIDYNLDKGTFKIKSKTNFMASVGIIDKYTYDKVQRALEVERLYDDQKGDE